MTKYMPYRESLSRCPSENRVSWTLAHPRNAFVEQLQQQRDDHHEVERAHESRPLLHDQLCAQYAPGHLADCRHSGVRAGQTHRLALGGSRPPFEEGGKDNQHIPSLLVVMP